MICDSRTIDGGGDGGKRGQITNGDLICPCGEMPDVVGFKWGGQQNGQQEYVRGRPWKSQDATPWHSRGPFEDTEGIVLTASDDPGWHTQVHRGVESFERSSEPKGAGGSICCTQRVSRSSADLPARHLPHQPSEKCLSRNTFATNWTSVRRLEISKATPSPCPWESLTTLTNPDSRKASERSSLAGLVKPALDFADGGPSRPFPCISLAL